METYQCEWHYRNLSEYNVLVWLPAYTDTHTEIIDTICSVADVLLRGTEIKPWLGMPTFPPPHKHPCYLLSYFEKMLGCYFKWDTTVAPTSFVTH